MSSLVIKQGVKIMRTPEQIAELEELKKMSYDEIDLSDIPEITHEEFVRARERKLRKKNLKKTA